MKLIFSSSSYEVALVYLVDIIMFGKNFEEHLERLELVFGSLEKNGLKIKGSKCNFFQRRMYFGPRHLCVRSGSGPRESERSRES